jgi:hypothetical protein
MPPLKVLVAHPQTLAHRQALANDNRGGMAEERNQVRALHKDEIREKIAAGVASLRAGQSVDGDAFMAAMDAELAEIEQREPGNARPLTR